MASKIIPLVRKCGQVELMLCSKDTLGARGFHTCCSSIRTDNALSHVYAFVRNSRTWMFLGKTDRALKYCLTLSSATFFVFLFVKLMAIPQIILSLLIPVPKHKKGP